MYLFPPQYVLVSALVSFTRYLVVPPVMVFHNERFQSAEGFLIYFTAIMIALE